MKKAEQESFKEFFRQEIQITIRKELAPIVKMVDSHQQTLHGAEGEKTPTGLVNEVSEIRKKVLLITTGISTFLTGLVNLGLYLLKGK